MNRSAASPATLDATGERFLTDLETIQGRPDLQVVPLKRNDRPLLAGLSALGRVASTTANGCVTCTLRGRAVAVTPLEGGDLVFDDRKGLRWFGEGWRHSVAALRREDHGRSPSLMFFSAHGELLHRVALDGLDDWDAFCSLVKTHQGCLNCLKHTPAPVPPLAAFSAPDGFLRELWRDARSPHDLDTRIEKLGLDRLQVIQALEGLHTSSLDLAAFAALLERLTSLGLPALLQVGNRHCTQVVECTLESVACGQAFWRLLGNELVLRMDASQLDSVWSVADPGAPGGHGRLECYDVFGSRVLSLACPPSPCPVVGEGWRRLLEG